MAYLNIREPMTLKSSKSSYYLMMIIGLALLNTQSSYHANAIPLSSSSPLQQELDQQQQTQQPSDSNELQLARLLFKRGVSFYFIFNYEIYDLFPSEYRQLCRTI